MSADTPSSKTSTESRRSMLVSKIESYWHDESLAVIPPRFGAQTADLSINALQSLLSLTIDATKNNIPLSTLWEEPQGCLYIALNKNLEEKKAIGKTKIDMAHTLLRNRLAGACPVATKTSSTTNHDSQHQTPSSHLNLQGFPMGGARILPPQSFHEFAQEASEDATLEQAPPISYVALHDSNNQWSLAVHHHQGEEILYYYDPVADSCRRDKIESCAKTWIPSPTVLIQVCPTSADDFSDSVMVPFIMMTLIDGHAVPRQLDIAYCRSKIIEQCAQNIRAAPKLPQGLPIDPGLLQQTPLPVMKRRRSRSTDTEEITRSQSPGGIRHNGYRLMTPLPPQDISTAKASDWMLLLSTHDGAHDKTDLDKYKTQAIDAIRVLFRELVRVDEVARELSSLKEVERSANAASKENERQTSAYKTQIASLLSALDSEDSVETISSVPDDLVARIQASKRRRLESSSRLEDAQIRRKRLQEECQQRTLIMRGMVTDLKAVEVDE
ncbi:hypothetical protein EsH8_XV_000028 [Colletotrichum jinshuiense]